MRKSHVVPVKGINQQNHQTHKDQFNLISAGELREQTPTMMAKTSSDHVYLIDWYYKG